MKITSQHFIVVAINIIVIIK